MSLFAVAKHDFSGPHYTFLLSPPPPPHACPVLRQVFGVLDSPEYSGVNTGVYRPVINDGKDEQANLPSDGSAVDPLHGFIPGAVSTPPTGPVQVKPTRINPRLHVLIPLHAVSFSPVPT